MSYGSLSAELSGYLPGLSGYLAEDFIRRAWRKIRDARLWSFLITDDAIVCPAQLTAGTYNIIQFNNQVTADAVASAAFATISPVILPPQFLQLRFQGAGTTSQIYNIASVDTTNPAAYVFTLDRVVEEPTNPLSSYLCYRPYIAAPTPDFLRFLSVVDMVNGWQLYLDRTSTQFDAVDPQRQNLGQAYYVGSYKYSDEQPNVPTVPIYELYPGPTSGQTFFVRYRRRGVDFSSPDDVQPDVIPDDLIIQTALCTYAYPFAMANQGHFPAMKGINWMQLIRESKREVYGEPATRYVGMLQQAKVQDDNIQTQSVLNRGHGLRTQAPFPYPIDANFLQGHLVPL